MATQKAIKNVRKRNGSVVPYKVENIGIAINKALLSCNVDNWDLAMQIATKVEDALASSFLAHDPSVEEIQDVVEAKLAEYDFNVAKAFILYRDVRNRAREQAANQSKDFIALNAQVVMRKNGFFQIDKDQQALQAYLEFVDKNTLKFDDINTRMAYLIDNGFYEDFYVKYSKSAIADAYNLILSHNFKFASFMSASKFFNDYALKTPDKKTFLETYEQKVLSVSLHLANGNVDLLMEFARVMITQQYQPATPTFLDAGKKRRGHLVSCFLLEMDDSLNSISFNISQSMYLSKIGGGVAVNASKLRARGESVNGIQNACKGVVPVLKLYEDTFNYADKMGQRKGAGAVYLNIFHADVEDFLDTKKINADEKSRIQSLSLGLTVPNKFFELAKDNAPYYVFYPFSVYQEYGIHLDDMDIGEMYDKLVENPNVRKRKLDARDMLNTIAKTQFESGYPYIVYTDTANQGNPLKLDNQGNPLKIKMSNLCTEIFQVQKSSEIYDYGIDGKKVDYDGNPVHGDKIESDISCVLGSLNIVNVMENKDIELAVKVGTYALTKVTDSMTLTNAPTIQKGNNESHAIGLGAMNLHGYLTKNRIHYESEEAKDFANIFFMTVNFYSIKYSMQIAKEKYAEELQNAKAQNREIDKLKYNFKYFQNSDYATGVYFDKYTSKVYEPQTARVAELFDGIHIPTVEEWTKLKEEVAKHGMYHAYRLTIAPTQSISYLQNSTPSIQPSIEPIETRTYGNSTTYYPMPYLDRNTIEYYKPAYAMDNTKIIDLVATIQPHIDQGISTVLYATNMMSTRELARLYLYAHRKGLKSLYYTRTKNLTIDECVLCSV